jgi:hypothetical protein
MGNDEVAKIMVETDNQSSDEAHHCWSPGVVIALILNACVLSTGLMSVPKVYEGEIPKKGVEFR